MDIFYVCEYACMYLIIASLLHVYYVCVSGYLVIASLFVSIPRAITNNFTNN